MQKSSITAASIKIVIHASELDRIGGWAVGSPRIETGGDLFGYRTHSGIPVVSVALGPGPRARHQSTAFFQDTEFLKTIGGALNRSYGLQYIGEWHSHHEMGLDYPSGGDCTTVANVFKAQPFDDFLLCIVNLRRSAEVTVGAFHFVRGQPGPTKAGWVVLDEESPIAATVYADRALQLRSPAPHRNWTVTRTTLDAPLMSLKPAPLQGVMNRPGGNAFLEALRQGLRDAGVEAKIFLPKEGDVQLRFRSVGEAFYLSLPNDFPDKQASLRRDDEKSEKARLLPAIGHLDAARFLAEIHYFIGKYYSPSSEPAAEPDATVASLTETATAMALVAADPPAAAPVPPPKAPLQPEVAAIGWTPPRRLVPALVAGFAVLAFGLVMAGLQDAKDRLAAMDRQVAELRQAQSQTTQEQLRSAGDAGAALARLSTGLTTLGKTIEVRDANSLDQLHAMGAAIGGRVDVQAGEIVQLVKSQSDLREQLLAAQAEASRASAEAGTATGRLDAGLSALAQTIGERDSASRNQARASNEMFGADLARQSKSLADLNERTLSAQDEAARGRARLIEQAQATADRLAAGMAALNATIAEQNAALNERGSRADAAILAMAKEMAEQNLQLRAAITGLGSRLDSFPAADIARDEYDHLRRQFEAMQEALDQQIEMETENPESR